MKFSKAKKKLAEVGMAIRKEKGGWIVFSVGEKNRAKHFKTQAEALGYALPSGAKK